METGRITDRLTWLSITLASLASVWLLVFFVLTKIVGPLNPDEIYFSHTFWLTLHGQRQFVDFYSQHLPTYFLLYDFMIPGWTADKLEFVWIIRISNLLVLAAYVTILFVAARRSAIVLVPLLLLLVTISRAIEIRSDTLGLLAFNGAWAVLLVGKSRRSMALATVFALIAASFSVRALVIGVGFGAALAWRATLRRDRKSLVVPAAMLACTMVGGVAAYMIDPRYVRIMLDSTVFSPSGLLVHVPIAQRIFAFDRFPQIMIATAALLLGIASARKGDDKIAGGVVAIASLAQLLLIFVDPSPFPYVYAWTLIPGLVGLTFAEQFVDARKWLAALGTAAAAGVAGAVILYPVVTGREAPVGSNYRLFPDPNLSRQAVHRLSVPDLVRLMLSREHQQSLFNQLLIRAELCRRVAGTVLSAWQSHPVCMRDATYYWFSIKWPNINLAGPPPAHARWFTELFRRRPPDIFIWDPGLRGAPMLLNPFTMSLLGSYEIHAGFALRRVSTAATDSFDRATTRPNNVPR